MNKNIINNIDSALEELDLEKQGHLNHKDDFDIVIFGVELQEYKVTGAISVSPDPNVPRYHFSCNFAVCSDDDRYKEELGQDIAIGRAMKNNENQGSAGGSLSLKAALVSFLEARLGGLEKALHLKRNAENQLRQAEIATHNIVNEELQPYL